ncbi:MAG TPA: hypothetical protein VFJ47_05620, partial [Terriglobales bacterium]|nr:hypothetical protein [Terriglobales bacterium]
PILQRGKPKKPFEPAEHSAQPAGPAKKAATSSKPATKAPTAAPAPSVQLIPAISDADGPEPRPYSYDLKPEEEQKYRQKILALATEDLRNRARRLGELQPEASPRSAGSATQRARRGRGSEPVFDDVQLHFFDLSTSNEPVLVLTATARMRRAGFAPATAEELQYFITLVARADIYGDLHKLLSNVTDTRHLDAIPRMELIDAVDVDGDGRGELLFRQISDAGSAFDVYRVTGDQLWPLFEGTPQ